MSPLHPNITNLSVPNSYWDEPTTIVLAITMTIIILLAFFGNALVLVGICVNKRMHTKTNAFIANLAIADLLAAVLAMPVAMTTVIKGDWAFRDTQSPDSYSDFFCVFNAFTVPFFLTVSVHTLMYIAIHKSISIAMPMKKIMTKTKVGIMIAASWIWGFTVPMLGSTVLSKMVYKKGTTQCGPEYPSEIKGYTYAMIVIVSDYVIPFTVMTVAYISIFIKIKAHLKRMKFNTNAQEKDLMNQKNQMTVTLFIMVIVFVVCWTPFLVYAMYVSAIEDKENIPSFFNALSYWFGYGNSACNPIIYALRVPAFRESYRYTLSCGRDEKNDSGINAKVYSYGQTMKASTLSLQKSRSNSIANSAVSLIKTSNSGTPTMKRHRSNSAPELVVLGITGQGRHYKLLKVPVQQTDFTKHWGSSPCLPKETSV